MTAAAPFSYTAEQLFDWIAGKPDFVLLDVRNEKEFANWYVEGPSFFPYINVPYFNFMEDLQESINMIPAGEKIRIVCAKEGSAKYVAEQLTANGFDDVGYLQGGIVSWGNVLAARLVTPASSHYSLYQVIRPGKASCSYLLISGSEAMVFDPSRNVDFYIRLAAEKGAQIVKTCETHRQADYISGSIRMAEKTCAVIMVKKEDFLGADFVFNQVEDGQILSFTNGGPQIKVIHTPGHTMGSTSYLIDGKYLLSGDTVFINTAGRPDLGGKSEEWSRFLYLTLTLKIRNLSDETLILPGHYTAWDEVNSDGIFMDTLGDLRKKNIAFHLSTEHKFAEFIKANLRPQPAVYAQIRRVNGGWLKVADEEADVMDLGKNECGASNYGKVGVSAEKNRASD
ncbi:MAG: MBL fold metallo-hydrolase [Proteobacteria bacterium]|nr:MBL fold metallo-hydrolase [Pseudomonadota bacterium]MBU4295988.1 MBL fold metallo-hydrolase [Pseudomonadota bacterium]MCG2747981.1 MBL fold metallo-hydrolase [Desulfobulbaceae bacterium]